jgi:alkylation response protein AidB-like acyl-CoA dehydrogenase
MERQIFTEEHDAFRETVRTFLAKEVTPHYEQWEKDGIVSREAWLAAGRQGLLGLAVPEEYGGGGNADFRYSAVIAEEFTRAGAAGLAIGLHNDIIGPYLTSLATDEQKRRWLPGFCDGSLITAIAMTEPGAGSDLQGIRTSAEDRGDHARRRRPRPVPPGRRARHGGLRAWPQPRQDRPEVPGHGRALLQRRTRSEGESPR